jgi:hypothetical protein
MVTKRGCCCCAQASEDAVAYDKLCSARAVRTPPVQTALALPADEGDAPRTDVALLETTASAPRPAEPLLPTGDSGLAGNPVVCAQACRATADGRLNYWLSCARVSQTRISGDEFRRWARYEKIRQNAAELTGKLFDVANSTVWGMMLALKVLGSLVLVVEQLLVLIGDWVLQDAGDASLVRVRGRCVGSDAKETYDIFVALRRDIDGSASMGLCQTSVIVILQGLAPHVKLLPRCSHRQLWLHMQVRHQAAAPARGWAGGGGARGGWGVAWCEEDPGLQAPGGARPTGSCCRRRALWPRTRFSRREVAQGWCRVVMCIRCCTQCACHRGEQGKHVSDRAGVMC